MTDLLLRLAYRGDMKDEALLPDVLPAAHTGPIPPDGDDRAHAKKDAR
jgi:hypothetical protein